MKFFLITMLFCCSVLCESLCAANIADFSGQWTGQATYVNKKDVTYLCDEVTLNIQQKPTQAQFGKFLYSCGGVAISFTPPTLTLDNGKISYKNQRNDGVVGEITETQAVAAFNINDQHGRDRYTLKKTSATEIDYLYEEIDVDPTTGKDVEATVTAKLKLVPPATQN